MISSFKKKLQPHKHSLLFQGYIQLGGERKDWNSQMAVLVTSLSNWLHRGSSQRPLRLQQKCLNTYDNEKQDQLSLPSDAIRNPSEQTLYQMWQVFVSRLISQAVPTLWSIQIVVAIQTNGGSVKTTKEKIAHLTGWSCSSPCVSVWAVETGNICKKN